MKCTTCLARGRKCFSPPYAMGVDAGDVRDKPCRAMRAVMKLATARERTYEAAVLNPCPPGTDPDCTKFEDDKHLCEMCWARWATRCLCPWGRDRPPW